MSWRGDSEYSADYRSKVVTSGGTSEVSAPPGGRVEVAAENVILFEGVGAVFVLNAPKTVRIGPGVIGSSIQIFADDQPMVVDSGTGNTVVVLPKSNYGGQATGPGEVRVGGRSSNIAISGSGGVIVTRDGTQYVNDSGGKKTREEGDVLDADQILAEIERIQRELRGDTGSSQTQNLFEGSIVTGDGNNVTGSMDVDRVSMKQTYVSGTEAKKIGIKSSGYYYSAPPGFHVYRFTNDTGMYHAVAAEFYRGILLDDEWGGKIYPAVIDGCILYRKIA